MYNTKQKILFRSTVTVAGGVHQILSPVGEVVGEAAAKRAAGDVTFYLHLLEAPNLPDPGSESVISLGRPCWSLSLAHSHTHAAAAAAAAA